MQKTQPGFSAEKRAPTDNRKIRTDELEARVEQSPPRQESFGERWGKVQPTKTILVWSCLAAIILTMIVGFNWGGWVTGGTAQKMATVAAQTAVVQRLAPICVAQFNLDPAKAQKLTELQATSTYERGKYVTTQGWATMPGEAKPDSKVADACAKQIMLSNP
jgi:hypothetical protein